MPISANPRASDLGFVVAKPAIWDLLSSLLVNEGSASCAEMRGMLAVLKSAVATVSAAQASAAASIAGRERHGDGGAQVLADTAGLTRRDAHSQVKTAKTIEAAPAVRDAVESGRVSQANARRLAEAIEKTSAADVGSDAELLAKAASMRPEQFTREARRWATDRQGDGGEADYRHLRARRGVRIWDTDDGMVALRGEFDPVAGRRLGNRLQAEARRLYDTDKKNAVGNGSERRSFAQCMADALDSLTATGPGSGAGKPFADICVVAHVDNDTGELIAELAGGELIAELAGGERLPQTVLEEFACNAKFTGVVYDREGNPIWRAHSVRVSTEAQRQILIARYGGCFHCKANPAMCQIHHIEPVSQGGATSLKNMVPVCWDCHNKIHHHNWQIHTGSDGTHTLHPPDRVTYGPAHAPEHPILHPPGTDPDALAPRRPTNTTAPSKNPILHLPGTDPPAPRPAARTEQPPGQPSMPTASTQRTTTPTNPAEQPPAQPSMPASGCHPPNAPPAGGPAAARPGPAAARAALHDAGSKRSGSKRYRPPANRIGRFPKPGGLFDQPSAGPP